MLLSKYTRKFAKLLKYLQYGSHLQAIYQYRMFAGRHRINDTQQNHIRVKRRLKFVYARNGKIPFKTKLHMRGEH